MKRLVLILEGAADDPIAELDGRSPLQAAVTSELDRLGAMGRLGTASFVPHDWPARAETSLMSCLGYDPKLYPAGRAALEAAVRELAVGPRDQVLRCDFVCVEDGVLRDAAPRNLASAEMAELRAVVNRASPAEGYAIESAGGHRNLAVLSGSLSSLDGVLTPPFDAIDQPIQKHLPRGKRSTALTAWMRDAAGVLAPLESNAVRAELGESPANAIWFWGEGPRPKLPRFRERFGDGAALVPDSLLMNGLARVARLEVFEPPESGGDGGAAAGLPGIAAAALAAFEKWDTVFVHSAAADCAGHAGRATGKLLALESLDRELVRPLLERVQRETEWRVLVLTAHATLLGTRTHANRPTLFALAGSRLESNRGESFDEIHAATGELRFERGCDVIEYFLRI